MSEGTVRRRRRKRVGSLRNFKEWYQREQPDLVRSLFVSSKSVSKLEVRGNYLWCISDDKLTLHRFDLSCSDFTHECWEFRHHFSLMSVSKDGSHVALGFQYPRLLDDTVYTEEKMLDGMVYLWSPLLFEFERELIDDRRTVDGPLSFLHFAEMKDMNGINHEYLFTGFDREFKVWNISPISPRLQNLRFDSEVRCICQFGEMLMVGLSDGCLFAYIRVYQFDCWRRREIQTDHKDSVLCVASLRQSSIIITGSKDRTLSVIDYFKDDQSDCFDTRLHLRGHLGSVVSVVISDRYPNLCYSGSEDCTIRIWDYSIGACIRVLRGHSGPITDLSLDCTGRHLCTASTDGSIRVWFAGADVSVKYVHMICEFMARKNDLHYSNLPLVLLDLIATFVSG